MVNIDPFHKILSNHSYKWIYLCSFHRLESLLLGRSCKRREETLSQNSFSKFKTWNKQFYKLWKEWSIWLRIKWEILCFIAPIAQVTVEQFLVRSEKEEGRTIDFPLYDRSFWFTDLPKDCRSQCGREEQEKTMNFTQLLVTLGCLVFVACTKQGDLLSTSTIKKYGE